MNTKKIRDDSSEARAAWSLDKYVLVIELLTKSEKKSALNHEDMVLLADAYSNLGFFKLAEKGFLEALKDERRENKGMIICNLALLFKKSGKYALAEEWFAKAAKFSQINKKGWFWVLRGANLMMIENFKKSEKCYRKAIEVGEVDLEEVYLNLGYCLRNQKRYKEAIKSFKKAYALDPKNKIAQQWCEELSEVLKI